MLSVVEYAAVAAVAASKAGGLNSLPKGVANSAYEQRCCYRACMAHSRSKAISCGMRDESIVDMVVRGTRSAPTRGLGIGVVEP